MKKDRFGGSSHFAGNGLKNAVSDSILSSPVVPNELKKGIRAKSKSPRKSLLFERMVGREDLNLRPLVPNQQPDCMGSRDRIVGAPEWVSEPELERLHNPESDAASHASERIG